MRSLRQSIILLAVLEGGWLRFDGLRGIGTGDSVAPSSGSYAGQLDSWPLLVQALIIEPRASLMMGVHVALSGGWMFAMIGFVQKEERAMTAMFWCAVSALGKCPLGPMPSTLQIVPFLQLRRASS